MICCHNLHFRLLDTCTDNRKHAIAKTPVESLNTMPSAIYASNGFDIEFCGLITNFLQEPLGLKFIIGGDFKVAQIIHLTVWMI